MALTPKCQGRLFRWGKWPHLLILFPVRLCRYVLTGFLGGFFYFRFTGVIKAIRVAYPLYAAMGDDGIINLGCGDA